MAEQIIPPRRGEILSKEGIGTVRFMEYLERTAGQVNESTSSDEESSSTLNIAIGQIGALVKSFDQLQTEFQSVLGLRSEIHRINKRLDEIEIQLTGTIDLNGIKKEIEELRILVN